MSVRRVDLAQLLEVGEWRWRGRLQLTANNRLITFDVKHSFADPTLITDHEHLDPFRADPTHLPLTRLLRARAGRPQTGRGTGRKARPMRRAHGGIPLRPVPGANLGETERGRAEGKPIGAGGSNDQPSSWPAIGVGRH